MIKTDKRDRLTILSMSIIMLLTHIYRWTNTMFNHDSLLVYTNDTWWQYSLGRFLNPVYMWARGRIEAPMVIGVLGSIYLIVAAILLVRMFDLKKPVYIIFFCGLMATHESLAYLNASFLMVFDAYMLSFLFAVLAVWTALFTKFKGHYIASICAMVISTGIYQNYIEVFVFCVLVVLLRRLLKGEETKVLWLEGWKCAGVVITSGVVYYILQSLVQQYYHLDPADSYNGLTHLLDFNNIGFFKQLINTWVNGFLYLYNPEIIHRALSRGLHFCVILYAAYSFVRIIKDRQLSKKDWVLMLFLLLMMPFGINLVYFLSGGLKYSVMRYPFMLFYGLLLMIMDIAGEKEIRFPVFQKQICVLVNLLLCLLIMNHFIFANQLYLKKHLNYETTQSIITRMINRMEETEGFIPGETPIAVLGYINDSPLSRKRFKDDFDQDYFAGAMHNTSISHTESLQWYFNYILNYSNKILNDEETKEIKTWPEVSELTVFPAEGSVKMIQNVMVIRVSEDLRSEQERYQYKNNPND